MTWSAQHVSRGIALLLAISSTLVGCVLLAATAGGEDLPDFDQLPEVKELPNPLVMLDGTPVTLRQDWEQKRKPELKNLFQHYMYGYLPRKPEISATTSSRDDNCLAGKAICKQVAISVGPPDCPKIQLLVVIPKHPPAGSPPPVFVALNFTGNHTVMSDKSILLPTVWLLEGPGVVEHRATHAGRGTAAAAWPVEEIIDRGYALATFCYSDVMPDKPGFQDGIYPYFKRGNERGPDEWGCIAAWAWGLQRAVDYVVTDGELDAQRIVAFGHSRNGKAALLAAAFDERIAAAIPHQAGCGGTAPDRRKNPQGEPVERINEHFPHWFDEIFWKFGGHEDKLPFDQNCLVALCAPRAVLASNGDQDQWADPPGQFEVLRAATPVYRLLGRQGLPDDVRQPIDGELVGAELSYYVRHEKHLVDSRYWQTFMDFADRVLAPAK